MGQRCRLRTARPCFLRSLCTECAGRVSLGPHALSKETAPPNATHVLCRCAEPSFDGAYPAPEGNGQLLGVAYTVPDEQAGDLCSGPMASGGLVVVGGYKCVGPEGRARRSGSCVGAPGVADGWTNEHGGIMALEGADMQQQG